MNCLIAQNSLELICWKLWILFGIYSLIGLSIDDAEFSNKTKH